MIEVIGEVVFTIIGEILFQVVAELLFDLGIASIGNTMKMKKVANPYLAGFGYVLLGVISGLIVSWFFPERIIPRINLHGASTIIAALGSGTVMMFYGNWRTSRGKHTTFLATFWGGSLFAFAMALTRWILVQI
jgi:hypothetical protein